MNIETLQWDTHLCNFFEISKTLLPEIRSSSEVYGVFADGVLKVSLFLRILILYESYTSLKKSTSFFDLLKIFILFF